MPIPIYEKLILSIAEASEYSGIGINKLRDMANEKGCPFSLKNGNHTMIKRKEFERYISLVEKI